MSDNQRYYIMVRDLMEARIRKGSITSQEEIIDAVVAAVREDLDRATDFAVASGYELGVAEGHREAARDIRDDRVPFRVPRLQEHYARIAEGAQS